MSILFELYLCDMALKYCFEAHTCYKENWWNPITTFVLHEIITYLVSQPKQHRYHFCWESSWLFWFVFCFIISLYVYGSLAQGKANKLYYGFECFCTGGNN